MLGVNLDVCLPQNRTALSPPRVPAPTAQHEAFLVAPSGTIWPSLFPHRIEMEGIIVEYGIKGTKVQCGDWSWGEGKKQL